MDLIQEGRYLLNLIEDNPRSGRPIAGHRFEGMRILRKLQEERRIQEVEIHCLAEDFSEPCALPRAARAEEEERPLRSGQRSLDMGLFHDYAILHDCCKIAMLFYGIAVELQRVSIPLHAIHEGLEVVHPLLGFKQIDLVRFDEEGQVFLQRHHLLLRPVARLGLQL